MKTVFSILFCFCLLVAFPACKHDRVTDDSSEVIAFEPGQTYEGQGQIVSAEFAACVCCGGYWLETFNPEDSVLVRNIPEDAGFLFDNNVQFPFPVTYKIVTDSTLCWDLKHSVHALSLIEN